MGLREDILEHMRISRDDAEQKMASGELTPSQFLDSFAGQLLLLMPSSVPFLLDIPPGSEVLLQAGEFALQAAEQGLLLPSPYPYCFLYGPAIPEKNVGILLVRLNDDSLWTMDFQLQKDAGSGERSLSLSKRYSLDRGTDGIFYESAYEASAEHDGWMQVDADPEKIPSHGSLGLAFLGLLAMRNITKTSSPAPEKLNKARAKKGRPEIPEITTIRLSPEAAREDRGGTHASPRPHWRRGHLRRLSSGKLIPIPPHPVMGDAPMPKGYAIKE